MANPFSIVKDSSIWQSTDDFSAVNDRDNNICVGVVKSVFNEAKSNELRFLVEVQKLNDKIEINCKLLRRFGGVYNYEDYTYRGYKYNDKPDPVNSFDAKAGDVVLVAFLNGQGREGVILGGVGHSARSSTVKASDGPQYKSEFNGIEQSINKDGEYIVTFKGQPTNLASLNNTPAKRIPAATYDTSIGTSYYKFDKTGSYELSDNAKVDKQFFRVDKAKGYVHLVSGKISLKLTKASETVNLKCKVTDIISDDKFSLKTKEFLVDASDKATIKSPKVAIGKDGVELLDQLAKLIDALGKVQTISPVGPCTPLIAAPNWAGVEEIKAKIKEITGSL